MKMRASGGPVILGLSFLGLTTVLKVCRELSKGIILELEHFSQATLIYCAPTVFAMLFSPSW